MSEQVVEKVSLYMKEGTTDKEYHAQVVAKDGAHVVNFQYGRRGAALQAGTKTASPVPLDKAMKIFEKLVAEKTAKGYTEGASGTPYQGTAKADQVTGLLPQLLNPVDEDEAEKLLDDPAYWTQEKFDGRRVMVRSKEGKVTGSNRKGLEVALPAEFAKVISSWGMDLVLDGEHLGGQLVAFDLLELDGADLRGLPYSLRLDRLDRLALEKAPTLPVSVACTQRSTGGKKAAFAKFKKDGREGIVFKKHDAHYKAGRPASGGSQLKHKFYATCSAIVAQGRDGKRSVALELIDGKEERVPIGNVTILPNFDMPKAGDVVEVRYLYAYEGGSLYQPIYLGKRDDVGHEACVVGQLKYKSKDEEEG